MPYPSQTPNHREIVAAQSTITHAPEYLSSTNGFLNVNTEVTVGAVTVDNTNANLFTGQKTVSTTAVQVSSASHSLNNGIIIKAPTTNSASIFVGLTGVTTSTGDILEPGESRGYAVDDTNMLYIISVASTTDIVSYAGN